MEVEGSRISGVRLDTGVLRADAVVLAVGIWGPALASSVGVTVPMIPVEHPYAFTAPRPELGVLGDEPIAMPIVRYPEHTFYCRQHGPRYGFGSYAHDPIPVPSTEVGATAERPFRANVFEPALARAYRYVPGLRGVAVERRLDGIFALTPDELPLVGECREVTGLWLAEASWITHAGGVGRMLAGQLLGADDSSVDPDRLNPNRFHDWDADRIKSAALHHYQGIYETH